MDIVEIKKMEIGKIIDFYYHIMDYGHVYHHDVSKLDEPFRKILEGIDEVRKLMDDSYDM